MGCSLYDLGEFQRSRIHMEELIASYDPEKHRPLAFEHGWDLSVHARCLLALDLSALGYPGQALTQLQEAVAFARQLNHLFSLIFGLAWGCCLHTYRRDLLACQGFAEEGRQLSIKGGFPSFQEWFTFFLGWIRAERGEVEEGIVQMRRGLDSWRSTGHVVYFPGHLALIADASGRCGQVEEGLALVQEAIDLVEKEGQRYWEAEVHRVKGELLKLSSRESEVEACFRQAIEVARRQRAKTYELRATTSLGRLLQKEGRSGEARPLLSEIYGWFTEGFDTPDLKEARALLDELGGPKER